MDYVEAMQTGNFNKVPIMTGTVLTDGIPFFTQLPLDGEISEDYWNANRVYYFLFKPMTNVCEVMDEAELQTNMIKRFYLGKGNVSVNDSFFELLDMLNDANYLSPDQKVAEFSSKYVPVYNYRSVNGIHHF